MPLDWEIWLDANLSPILAKWMAESTGYTVRSAYTLAIQTDSDLEVYRKAKEKGKVILISKDSDFPELVNRLGSPPKLINLKIGNCGNKLLWETLKPSLPHLIDLLVSEGFDIVDFEH